VLFAVCILGVLVGIADPDTRSSASVAILLYIPALRLAFSKKNGRELLPMLKYSARTQLQLGALLAVVLVFRMAYKTLYELGRCFGSLEVRPR